VVVIERIYEIIHEVRLDFAPDPRVAVFEVDVLEDESEFLLFGATSVPAAQEALRQRLSVLDLRHTWQDLLVRLPAEMEGRSRHALVTAAVAPMLGGPLITETHLSQVVLGSRVMVLREHGRWLQCRSSDGYIGWIHRGYLRRVSEAEARGWEVGADAPVHLSLGAEVRDEQGNVAARLPWGARFQMRDGLAQLPDGSVRPLHGSVVPLAELRTRFPLEGSAIVATARLWTGAPYLWGGVTPGGVDCSGFVQAVYRTHGFDLPRDSDQQAEVGSPIPHQSGFDAVRPGDLLYFAEYRDRVSHVAIATGGSVIIHSALGNGGVGENDLEGTNPYERELRSLLVGIRRVISEEP
jgi:gamma-D-glutamyl-L-lysine dipeptidyl-peptidase